VTMILWLPKTSACSRRPSAVADTERWADNSTIHDHGEVAGESSAFNRLERAGIKAAQVAPRTQRTRPRSARPRIAAD